MSESEPSQTEHTLKVANSMVLSGFFEGGRTLLTALFFALLARHLTLADFGNYILIRKVAVWFLPISTFGTYIGLSYFLPYSHENKSKGQVIAASLVLVFFSFLLVCAGLVFFREFLFNLLFGNKNILGLLDLVLLIIAAETVGQYIISVYRGFLKIFFVNILRLLLIALIPLVVIFLGPNFNLHQIIFSISLMSIAFFSVLLLKIVFEWRSYFTFSHVVEGGRYIWKYCASRVPTNLIFTGMLSLWLVITAHYFDDHDVTYVSVGIALFGALSAFIVPFEIVLLPSMRKLSSKRIQSASANLVNMTVQCSYDLAIYISFQVLALAPFIIRWWLGGGDYAQGMVYLRVMTPMLFGYAIFTAVYGLVDEMSAKPINAFLVALSITSSLIFFITGRFVFHEESLAWLCISCALQFVILGISTVAILVKRFRLVLHPTPFLRSFLYSALSALLVAFVRKHFIYLGEYQLLCIIAATVVILFFVYIRVLAIHKVFWSCRMTEMLASIGQRAVPFFRKVQKNLQANIH